MLGIVQTPQRQMGLGHRPPLQEAWGRCDPLSKEMLPLVQSEPLQTQLGAICWCPGPGSQGEDL